MPDQQIHIDVSHAQIEIQDLPLSTRAKNVLKQLGISNLGELDGSPLLRVTEPRNCGRKTADEILRMLQRYSQPVGAGPLVTAETPPDAEDLISVPEASRGWPLDQLPLSVRLYHVLQRLNCKVFGDLGGLSYSALARMPDCGSRTMNELKRFIHRVQSGEFGAPLQVTNESPASFAVSKLDGFLETLPPQQQDILKDRLGATGEPLTLMVIGEKFQMTRERVRQIVNLLLKKALQFGGPPFVHALDEILKELNRRVLPLTPELLKDLMGAERPAPRYTIAFYVRLLNWISPKIPAWPVGQTPAAYRIPKQEAIINRLKEWFKGRAAPAEMSKAYRSLIESGATCSVFEFLEAVRFAAEFPLQLENAQMPLICPPVPTPRRWAQQVLSQSNSQQIPYEALARAKALVSSRRSPTSRYRLAGVKPI